MSCDLYIHDELLAIGIAICDFCNRQLVEIKSVDEACCKNKKVINNDGKNVCRSCGSVIGYDLVNPYIDLNENKYKITRKSFYIRKYHILNVVNHITEHNRIQITNDNRDKILRIFAFIGAVLSQVNNGRKRVINIKYILRQIFKILQLPYEIIPLSKSKKTLRFYDQYWKQVYDLIENDICLILPKMLP